VDLEDRYGVGAVDLDFGDVAPDHRLALTGCAVVGEAIAERWKYRPPPVDLDRDAPPWYRATPLGVAGQAAVVRERPVGGFPDEMLEAIGVSAVPDAGGPVTAEAIIADLVRGCRGVPGGGVAGRDLHAAAP
jgi:hypothetical protein